ncbi:MAG: hypothetical protein AB1757_00130 [Acidobacteriota bacterium]
MMNCKRIQKQIDEADTPDLLPFEVTTHLESCPTCHGFADERLSLRQLLSAMPGITVPANFQAQLKARLEERKTQPTFAWFTPANYLRFGTAAAVLTIGVFVAQYAGAFAVTSPNALTAVAANTEGLKVNPLVLSRGNDDQSFVPDVETMGSSRNNIPAGLISLNKPGAVRRYTPNVREEIADDFDMPTIIVTGPAGRVSERPIRPYSVGAQDRIYMRSEAATPVRVVSF